MKICRYFSICLLALNLVSCASTAVLDETKDKQVQEEVITLLEQEYNQPFKIVDFKYEYRNHYQGPSDCVFLYCKSHKYGDYIFKVKAVDNPIIVMNFKLPYADKESIKELIDSFKKNQLKKLYCSAFDRYYFDVMNKKTKIIQPYTAKTEKFCDNRGQTSFHTPRDYYLKHKDEYK